ncbi:protein phosphatase 1 regulatory subunit 15B-like [Toxotes jaculatrix]|uniref:protein phosphatase 1 regulatory subunit 15B-like n=1 Tax=Toxotes jaculatrix TaxID=941984 RepID=UPI001B3A9E9D|nr:protein phosphatase 1 regulatory subunit 15B-like [Toxotes jaculatrix]
MFRNMSDEEHLSGGQSSSSPTRHGVTSAGLGSQESSWMGLLSVVSRPALTFLQKYLPGRSRNPAPSDTGGGWIGADLKRSFVDEEREFLRQLDDMMPLTQHAAPHLAYLRCQHDGAAGLLERSDGSTLPWLTADSLREMGIQTAEEIDLKLCQQTQIGYLSSARTVFSHVLLSLVSSQEVKPTAGKDWVTQAVNSTTKSGSSVSRTWWGSLWGGEESSQKGLLSGLSWAEEGTVTGRLCSQKLEAETKAPAAHTADVFVQSGGRESTLGENTGQADHKEDNGGLHTVQNTDGSAADHRLSISNHPSSSGAAAASGQVALLTPDQDNGYSSLEEEQFQMCHQYMVKALSGQQPESDSPENCAPVNTEMEEESPEEGEPTSGKVEEEEHSAPQEGASAEATVPSAPQCQNKAIAFIMGCPCSDDDSSQSDRESSDDDDGFDSEGSSDLSDLSDEDDEDDDEASDSDSEADSEAERLWRSLCRSLDPYNPQNFTAQLHTSSTLPRTIPTSTPPSSTQSSPASSPDLTPLPLSSFSPTSCPDVWDDSNSASEVDEAENLRLWSSFSCTSDPYSPFNFQAPLRTRGPVEAAPRARAKKASQTPPHSPHHKAPEYRKEEADERLDSGFSEPSTSSSSSSTQSCGTTKKVRFCDNVEEFFASCGEEEEDRRGPWEELARDRCRFLRRCKEVEQSIAYCLQPQHRSLVYRRLAVLYVQDA